MATVELSRRVGKAVAYPPLCEMSKLQRREFHEALLEADAFEDFLVSGRRGFSVLGTTGPPCGSSSAASSPTCVAGAAACKRLANERPINGPTPGRHGMWLQALVRQCPHCSPAWKAAANSSLPRGESTSSTGPTPFGPATAAGLRESGSGGIVTGHRRGARPHPGVPTRRAGEAAHCAGSATVLLVTSRPGPEED